MIRRIFVATLIIALPSCGESPDAGNNAKVPPSANPEVTAAASGDPCALLADPAATFGQPVTASVAVMPNATRACEWKTADGMMCGIVTVFGPGWNEVPDVASNYAAMVRSLGAFGQVQEIVGIGDEAHGVDGKMLGTQGAFRTNKAGGLVGGTCSTKSRTNFALVESVAREIATHL